MEVKDAVKLAKGHVAELFADERVDEIGLEETEYLDGKDEWRITIGFRRILASARKRGPFKGFPVERPERSFKVVRISNRDGKVLGVVDRILKEAA
jgi:hypothetical protein